MKWSSHVICISNDVQKQFGRLLERYGEKVHKIFNGLDLERFDRERKDAVGILKRYDLREEDRLILCIGRINSWKGQDVLIRSYRHVREKVPRTRLLIVGDTFPGNEKYLISLRRLVQTCNLEDGVIFTGFVRDVQSLLAAGSVLVLPSTVAEPFGMVVLEAMAMRLPVIATDAGGPKDIIENGVSGLLVPPKDERALGEATVKVLKMDPRVRESMQVAGRARVAKFYSLNRTVEAIEELYARTLRFPVAASGGGRSVLRK